MLFHYALFVSVDYLAAILAFALARKENCWLLIWLFWQRFFYRQFVLRGDRKHSDFAERRAGQLGETGA